MYVIIENISPRTFAFVLSESRYGDVYYSSIPVPHLKFDKEEDAVAFSLATGLIVYKDLEDRNHKKT